MFHIRTHSFTRAVITGGLLSLAVGTADTYAAPRTAMQEPPEPGDAGQ